MSDPIRGGQAALRSDPPRHSRPPAPDFDFSPKDVHASRDCRNCGTVNPSENRFCAACGTLLTAPSAPPQPASDSALVAAPVVGIRDPQRPAEQAVTCARCRGKNAASMHYCQYCGAVVQVDGSHAAQAAAGPVAPAPAAARPPAAVAPPAVPALPSARLVVIGQDGTPGRSHELEDEQVDVGRQEGAVRLPNDPYVSPRHARITYRSGRFFIQDLDSVNGVYVRLGGSSPLEHGDLVLVGLEVLRFEVVSDAEQGLGPAAERGTHVFGSPAVPRYGRLCQRTVEGVTRDVYYLSRGETVIGREAGDIVFTSDPFMSRRHASVSRDPRTNRFTLRDLGSSNGTYLAIRREVELKAGDHVRIGQHLFRLDVDPGVRS